MDKSKDQMEFLFEEGGMTDDGLDRDPVSGNEVPAGSLAEEVRDDIPAQLSEGEYVVPADVVRYYGVKYFEDLRDEAKEGLGEMEEDGRIGGEPVDMQENADDDLSDEERSELDSIMGMAMGGFVPQQDMQQPRGFFPGGLATQATVPEGAANPPADTQVPTTFPQFGPGFSFMGGSSGMTTPAGPSRNVTLYGPNGEVVSLILPAQQALYDDYVSKGYGTQPVSQVQTPTVQTREGGGRDQQSEASGEQSGMGRYGSLGKVDFSDPIGDAESALEGKGKTGAIAGGLVGALAGVPGLGAGIGKAIGQANSVAEATANAEIADLLGYDTTDINASIDASIDSMGFASRVAARTARDKARAQTKASFYSALSDPTSGIQFSLDRSSFQSQSAYDNALTGLARSVEESSGYAPGSVVAMGQGTDDRGSSFGRDFAAASEHARDNPTGMTTGQALGFDSSSDLTAPDRGATSSSSSSASDSAGDGGDSAKIVCTAMNTNYGFGSYRQAIWLRYSEKHLTQYHEKGYHKIFLPLVDRAYNRGDRNNKILRKVLENIARHRTADLRAEMQGKKRDTLGRIYRAVLEPICYIVGRLSK